MNVRCVLLISIILFSVSATVSAQPYISLNLGHSKINPENVEVVKRLGRIDGNRFEATVAGGFAFDLTRVELEIGYRNIVNKLDPYIGTLRGGGVDMVNYMLNGYLFAPRFSEIRPYVMAGAGIATEYEQSVTQSGITISDSHTRNLFAYQVGVGVALELDKHNELNFRIHYSNEPGFKYQDNKRDIDSLGYLYGYQHLF